MEGLLESFCLEVPSSLLQKGGKGEKLIFNLKMAAMLHSF